MHSRRSFLKDAFHGAGLSTLIAGSTSALCVGRHRSCHCSQCQPTIGNPPATPALPTDPAISDAGFRDVPGSTTRIPNERGRAEVASIPTGAGPVGYAVHLGVNWTYPKHYGSTNNLSGCVNDALEMRAITRDLKIPSTLLTNEYANIGNVMREIRSAARTLKSGDLFILTYAGHGANCLDMTEDESSTGSDLGDNPAGDRDISDETWCLYDEMLLDDELYAEWTHFKPGVRILVILDCCHSGTAIRSIFAARDRAMAQQKGTRSNEPAELDSAADEIAAFLLQGGEQQDRSATLGNIALSSGPPPTVRSRQQIRTLPRAYNDRLVDSHRDYYTNKQRKAFKSLSDGNKTVPQASILLLAACQDSQLAKEESGHGRFTHALFSAMRNEAGELQRYEKSYPAFLEELKVEIGAPSQTPNLYTAGADNPAFLKQLPFQV